MIDVQNLPDDRNVDIEKVGVKNISYPIIVLDKARYRQHTIANVNMYVDLPRRFKGTHMSRFVEILNRHHGHVDFKGLLEILDDLKHSLKAKSAHCEMTFPYFVEKRAPVSGEKSLMEYGCSFIGESGANGKRLIVGIQVPITTLCPCSKEISAKGAHNQRGTVTVKLLFNKFFWIEDVITVIESCASAEVFALLKREDEKALTERAYERPRFVEDVVREIAVKLNDNDNFPWFSVAAENMESIHNHSAYAYVEKSHVKAKRRATKPKGKSKK